MLLTCYPQLGYDSLKKYYNWVMLPEKSLTSYHSMSQNEENVVVDATQEESTEHPIETTEETPTEEKVVDKDATIGRLNRELTKAKKALEKTTVETPTEETAKAVSTEGGLSREEAILFAKGFSEEEVEKAFKIAQIEGVSIKEAVDGDFFKTWKESSEAKKKSEKASLATSKGSPKAKEQVSFETPGLEREDHKALFKKKAGI